MNTLRTTITGSWLVLGLLAARAGAQQQPAEHTLGSLARTSEERRVWKKCNTPGR